MRLQSAHAPHFLCGFYIMSVPTDSMKDTNVSVVLQRFFELIETPQLHYSLKALCMTHPY